MAPPTDRSPRDWSRPSLVPGIATLALHLVVNGGYGFSRDELYFWLRSSAAGGAPSLATAR